MVICGTDRPPGLCTIVYQTLRAGGAAMGRVSAFYKWVCGRQCRPFRLLGQDVADGREGPITPLLCLCEAVFRHVPFDSAIFS